MMNVTVNEMDWACADGIPGPEHTSGSGRSWFISCFSVKDNKTFKMDPRTAQSAKYYKQNDT